MLLKPLVQGMKKIATDACVAVMFVEGEGREVGWEWGDLPTHMVVDINHPFIYVVFTLPSLHRQFVIVSGDGGVSGDLNNNNNNSYGSYSGGSDQHGDWLLSVQHSDDLPPAVLATQQEQRRQWEVTLEGVCEQGGH